MRIQEVDQLQSKINKVKRFAAWAIEQLGIENPPTIKYSNDITKVKQHRTFGSTRSNGDVWTHIGNRNSADIMRTLCHELVHVKQFEDGIATNNMDDEQRLSVEDEANAVAGRMMRAYGKQHEDIYESKVGNSKLKAQLLKHRKTDYDSIDRMMTDIADKEAITPKELHDNWVEQYKKSPDAWIKQQLKQGK